MTILLELTPKVGLRYFHTHTHTHTHTQTHTKQHIHRCEYKVCLEVLIGLLILRLYEMPSKHTSLFIVVTLYLYHIIHFYQSEKHVRTRALCAGENVWPVDLMEMVWVVSVLVLVAKDEKWIAFYGTLLLWTQTYVKPKEQALSGHTPNNVLV